MAVQCTAPCIRWSSRPDPHVPCCMCCRHDGRQDRSTIVILDASDLAAGPLAQLHLRNPMPFSFHCMWSDAVHGPQSQY